jgi:dTDP-4-dehydrorhamnose reductase
MEISEKNINGIIHTSGATNISRYKMAELIFEKFNLDKTLLKAVSSDEMNWIAKRPKNSSLNTSLANSVLDKKPQSIEQSLNQFFDEIDSNDFNNNNSNN